MPTTQTASSVLEEVRTKAMKLPANERAKLAHELLDTLDDESVGADTPDEIEAAWAVEIARRSDEVHRGVAKLVDGEEALQRVRDAARRGQS